ncbi:MAG: hypothetical protein ACK42D_00180 [Candidatus Paceibacteria bacterium]
MKYVIVLRSLLFALLIVSVVSPVTSSAQSRVEEEGAAAISSSSTLASTEVQVREYFADIPVMIEIARCESNFRQFTDSGAVMRGGGSGEFIGIFQFTEAIHGRAALALGHDLATIEGNLAYARHIYTQQGTRPWSSCVPVQATPPMTDAQAQLKIELMTTLIGLLQELLKLKLAG